MGASVHGALPKWGKNEKNLEKIKNMFPAQGAVFSVKGAGYAKRNKKARHNFCGGGIQG
jgi:hypothetical protein